MHILRVINVNEYHNSDSFNSKNDLLDSGFYLFQPNILKWIEKVLFELKK